MVVKKIFGREDPDVVAQYGDYTSTQIANSTQVGVPGATMREAFDNVWSRCDSCAENTGDVERFKTIGIQQRPVADLVPNADDRLTWIAATQRWEPRPVLPVIITPALTVPGLLPAGWNGATYQHSLLRNPARTAWEVDNRAPGALATLTPTSAVIPTPDAIYQRLSALTRSVTGGGYFTGAGNIAGLQRLTDMTILIRVARSVGKIYVPPGTHGYIACCGNAAVSGEPGNFAWGLMGKHPTALGSLGCLQYRATYGAAQTPVIFTSTTIPDWTGLWEVVSLRRDAAGTTVRLGKNKIYQSGTVAYAPTGGESGLVRLGCDEPSKSYYTAVLADFNFFPTFLSDQLVDDATDLMLGTILQ